MAPTSTPDSPRSAPARPGRLTRRRKALLYLAYLLVLAAVAIVAGEIVVRLKGVRPWRPEPLAVTVDGDTTMVGNATIVEYDLAAANGTVHVIDAVLAPAG